MFCFELRNTCTLPRISYFNNFRALIIKRAKSSEPPPQTVLIERCIEDPVIVIPEKGVDLIGPPDRESNLRPIVRHIPLNETLLRKSFREFQNETQAWNQKFWSEHNARFICERDEYVKKRLNPEEDRTTLSTDEMSEFYRDFLDKTWRMHVRYNFEWYKRNLKLLFLALRVHLQELRN